MRSWFTTGLLLAAAACGDSDGPFASADAGPPADGASIDAPAVDAAPDATVAPVTDAAPRPDAIAGFTCAAPLVLAPGQSQLGNTENYVNGSYASCSAGTMGSKDTIYRVPLPAEPTDLIARVLTDTDAPVPFDVVLAIQSECGVETSEVACSDFGFSESLEALALTGEAFVLVDGTAQFGGSPAGSYQIDVATRAIVASAASCDPEGQSSRCEQGLMCVAGLCQSESASASCAEARALEPGVVQSATTHAYQGDLFQGSCAFDSNAGAGEAVFSFRLDQVSDIDITTDLPGTSFDTVIYLLATCQGAQLACADDIDPTLSNFRSRLQASDLPAGDYLLIVDGASSAAPTGRVSVRLDVTTP